MCIDMDRLDAPGDLNHLRSGDGPRLILLHGFTQTAASWQPVIDRLGPGYESIAIDLPGHGGSSTVAADLSTCAQLVARVGGAGCHIGYSMGGRVLLHLALDRPDLVQAMVLVSTTAGIGDPIERAARRSSDDALAGHIEAVGVDTFLEEWLAMPLFAGLDGPSAGRHHRATNTATGLAASLRTMGTGRQEPLWNRLRSLSMPVRVICGAEDAKFTALGRRLVDEIGPNASLDVLDGAGHALHLEDPDRFTAALRDWLDTVIVR